MARQTVYVPIESDERERLLQLLNMAASECWLYIDGNTGTGQSESSIAAVQRELDQIGVLYERIEDEVPLTRADMLRALRFIDSIPVGGWPASALEGAPTLYATLKARCTNVLRLAQAERKS